MPPHEQCPGCGLNLPVHAGPTHPYIGASASCWALFGEVLAVEYESPDLNAQMTVDAYAVQHPGRPERRAIQSVAIHLMTLCLWIEDGADPATGPAIHKRMTTAGGYTWLEPPQPNGTLTIADVHRAAATPREHEAAVGAWARDVWQAWAPHHATVREWLGRTLGR